MCLYPRLIRNKKYSMNKKNGGIIPAISDKRVLQVPVGCGKCIECKKQKARQWQIRLMEEIRKNKNGKFVTLTFSNESIKNIIEGKDIKGKKIKGKGIVGLEGYELDNEIAKVATRDFLERWRKKNKKSVKHWLVTELGHNGTENIHMHGIIWTDKNNKEIEETWAYGHVWVGEYVNEKTINYIIKYVTKTDEKNKYYNTKILTSPGIGSNYVNRKDAENNKYKKGETKESYTTRTGHEITMPVYWRNKIYTEEEREKLWLEKLDKQERWICGEKIDISKGEEEYYKLLEFYRRKNKKLGYGDDRVNWDRKNYENERRKLRIEERIRNANN